MKTSFSEAVNPLLFCLHPWVVLSNAICWQKYRQGSHTAKARAEDKKYSCKRKTNGKRPCLCQILKLIFMKTMHENCKNICLMYLQDVCLQDNMLNSLWWIFLSKFFCKINLYDLAKSGSNLGFSTECILSYWVPHCNHMCEK